MHQIAFASRVPLDPLRSLHSTPKTPPWTAERSEKAKRRGRKQKFADGLKRNVEGIKPIFLPTPRYDHG